MTRDSRFQVTPSSSPILERVGLVVDRSNAAAAVKAIVAVEDFELRQVLMGQSSFWPDPFTTFAAAAAKTSTIWMGTSVLPT